MSHRYSRVLLLRNIQRLATFTFSCMFLQLCACQYCQVSGELHRSTIWKSEQLTPFRLIVAQFRALSLKHTTNNSTVTQAVYLNEGVHVINICINGYQGQTKRGWMLRFSESAPVRSNLGGLICYRYPSSFQRLENAKKYKNIDVVNRSTLAL